jgi:hypothetical protein
MCVNSVMSEIIIENMFTVITFDQWEQDASKQETSHSLKIWWSEESMMLLNFHITEFCVYAA